MSKFSKGYIEAIDVVIVALVALVIGMVAWYVYAAVAWQNKYDRWTADCRSANGLVVQVSSTRLECFIDGKKVVLPGWESEQ